ncbi:hypothetical protein [Sulfolobus tengchongensis spindle-shaped virus 4]|nr:hypothetical protein [Sulfolobus tengchongensis spindle-shaped virus 4]
MYGSSLAMFLNNPYSCQGIKTLVEPYRRFSRVFLKCMVKNGIQLLSVERTGKLVSKGTKVQRVFLYSKQE